MELKSITFKSTATDKTSWINISSIDGAMTLMFHVTTDTSLTCQIFQTSYGWGWFLTPNTDLQSGDLYALIELIEFYWHIDTITG